MAEDSGEAGFSLQKAAQVRIDNLGLIKNHSWFVYNPNRIELLLEQRLELQRSIGRTEGIRKSSALEKDLAEIDKLSPLLFQAIAMYKANKTTKRGFTKDSIKSILLTGLWNHTTNQRTSFIQIRVVEVITATGQGARTILGRWTAQLLLLRAMQIYIGYINYAKKQR